MLPGLTVQGLGFRGFWERDSGIRIRVLRFRDLPCKLQGCLR